ncbi:MAG TPA: hypothetical protein VNA15_13150 [Candidatus Angelobacter sp.]|nr:hypothetical protein [Candidatus Angelobacter sp.]
MRRLLIKLVAIETALVGWLSYWLFLVYASNPSVADQLSSSLQRFPQLSFSTIDIAVMVIIATLAITLAFKFQRGLRPGIRLERALQMLENLMKRNLVLEAQVAELKIEKVHPTPPIATTPPVATISSEPRPGSWEKAFRTPLEAGPPVSARSQGANREDAPFGRETGVPPPRIEPIQQTASPTLMKPIMITEKGSERQQPQTIISDRTLDRPTMTPPGGQSASSWEDSPKFIGESRGILTPSSPTRRAPSVSESSGLRQPYIPAPAPRIVPPNVILGPMTSPTVPKIQPRPPRPTLPKNPVPSASPRPRPSEVTKPRPDTPPVSPSTVNTSAPEDLATNQERSEKTQPRSEDKSEDTTSSKDGAKPPVSAKKKFPYEED